MLCGIESAKTLIFDSFVLFLIWLWDWRRTEMNESSGVCYLLETMLSKCSNFSELFMNGVWKRPVSSPFERLVRLYFLES